MHNLIILLQKQQMHNLIINVDLELSLIAYKIPLLRHLKSCPRLRLKQRYTIPRQYYDYECQEMILRVYRNSRIS